jgi:hypothetical protein
MSTQTLAVGLDPQVEIEHVGGDLSIEGWDRAEIEVRGDNLGAIDKHDAEVVVASGGDLHLSVPHTASLTVGAVGGDLTIENLIGEIELSFVGGDATLRNLTGQVSLTGMIGGETQMENVTKVSMEGGKDGAIPDLTAKIQRKVEEATRRADRKVREVERQMRSVEIKMQHADRTSHRHPLHPVPPIPARPPVPPRGPASRSWYFGFDPAQSAEANQPVSDEERLVILKMLQEKKITSEQADKLLSALGGGGEA